MKKRLGRLRFQVNLINVKMSPEVKRYIFCTIIRNIFSNNIKIVLANKG